MRPSAWTEQNATRTASQGERCLRFSTALLCLLTLVAACGRTNLDPAWIPRQHFTAVERMRPQCEFQRGLA